MWVLLKVLLLGLVSRKIKNIFITNLQVISNLPKYNFVLFPFHTVKECSIQVLLLLFSFSTCWIRWFIVI